MKSVRPVQISGIGCYVPERVLTNHDLSEIVDTSDEWILQRTGISERRIVDKGKATSDMAEQAVRRLCSSLRMDPNEIELLIVATVTPDMFFPSTACLLQEKLGIKHTWGFDLSAACCGFVYSLSVGAAFVAAGLHSKVVVVGSDTMSSIIDYEDRATCVADQYSGYAVDADTHVNGRLTLGENTADNGGLRLALMAYLAGPGAKNTSKIDGFTPEQRVFLGWAQVWCENARPEAERLKAATNPHSSNKYRVNGPMSNMPEFQKAFSCKANAPMVRTSACRVW